MPDHTEELVEQVKQAYAKIGARPCQDRFLGDGECCPITALLLANGKANHKMSDREVELLADEEYGAAWMTGFIFGVDGLNESWKHGETETCIDGYDAGRAVGIAIFSANQEAPNASPLQS